tara:strand:- start:1722 stop:2003 length:282 start_codon:yes stop_codon:yes gene_type:complete
MQSHQKDFEKLKKELEEYQIWPSDYIFKFIIKNKIYKRNEILSNFDLKKCNLTTKESSNKKYLSITLIKHMDSADEVIKKYMELSKIDGIISL